MENLHTSSEPNSSNSLNQGDDIKLENSLYHTEAGSSHSIQSVSSLAPGAGNSYGTPINFTPMDIKEEVEEEGSKLPHSVINFQSGSVPVIATSTQLKVSGNQIMSTEVPIVSQNMQLTSGGSVLVSSNEASHKVLTNHQSVIPIGEGVNFSSSLNLSNPINHGSSIVACSQSNSVSQPVQMFHSSSFENCDGVLNQSQNSGQAFLLTSPGTVLSSNQMVSQGQVFLQGDELVGVTLANTAATTSGYTVSNSESQYVNTLPVVLSGNQTIGNSIPRLIIQSNQSGATNINNQILSSNNGHYLIQVGHSVPTVSQSNNFSINNKGHIVIKAGSSKIKDEVENISSSAKDGVFRVVIPEGTTKLPKVSQPLQVLGNTDDSIRKHVQINLSNRASLPSPSKISHYDTAVQTLKEPKPVEKHQPGSNRKLYECSNCNSKFMKPLYLRMHMRSCKKPEVKMEKTPLFMCSFCKATFKTKPQINHHFTKCSHSPYNSKESSGKRKLEEEEEEESDISSKKIKVFNVAASLEMAVQYKCQDCDRTFSKERQYTSHVKRCTKISVHDLSGARVEPSSSNAPEEEQESLEDPFADPPLPPPPVKRGRGGGGRRGRPPGRVANAAQKATPKNDALFEGDKVIGTSNSLIVADNENLVRSTAGLAHTVQLSLEIARSEGQSHHNAVVADSKGVHGRDKPPHAWSLVCSMCQKMFLTKAALANHMIESHGPDLRATRNILIGQNSEEKLYKCPLCHLHYQSSNTFMEHLVVQHTSKLQDHYKMLQSQTATFVCSLCSLVLLTKNLLMEHLSLEHLDHLEKTHYNSQSNKQKKKNQQSSTNGEVKEDQSNEAVNEEELEKGKYRIDLKSHLEEGNLECGFCGEEFENAESLITHYTSTHNLKMDPNGILVDNGVDVDIRVKNTKDLLHIGDGVITNDMEKLPKKTVLIRKKPKQSWQCQGCLQVFSRQMMWLRHVRDSCASANYSSGDTSKTTASRESHFFCHEPECSHLAFYQVKSLFKHMEDVHKIVVRKERKTFKSLAAFHQWLTEEEDSQNVRFIRDSTRVEKNNVRLIQMVCHRFHSAKLEQAKEKEESDMNKPTKKRWFMRIQRANNCHARIHLRVELGHVSHDYDGETQMIYYPQHFHNGEEDSPEILDKVREKYPREKGIGPTVVMKNASTNSCFAEGDSGSSFSLDSTSDILPLQTDDNSPEGQQPPLSQSQQQPSQQLHQSQVHNENNVSSVASLQVGPLIVPSHQSTPTMILPHSTPQRSSVIFDGSEQSSGVLVRSDAGTSSLPATSGKDLLIEGASQSPFIVMNADETRQNEDNQEFNEEYILPADEAEWTKLFDALSTRLSSGELSEESKKEAEALISYQTVISVLRISEQVSIFQRMCSLTNTSLESI